MLRWTGLACDVAKSTLGQSKSQGTEQKEGGTTQSHKGAARTF